VQLSSRDVGDEETLRFLHRAMARESVETSNAVAVVGVSIKVTSVDGAEEFWRSICKAESQHQAVPRERIAFEQPLGENDNKRFGNFIDDYDTFDHRFFKKTPREAAMMDPQQRLFLQCAYQAVCHSGWFNSSERDTNVGVYVGCHSADYEDNIACHAPNAFSATGNLRAFTAVLTLPRRLPSIGLA